MGLISRPRSNPAMVRAIARYCRYRDLSEVTDAGLQAVIAPGGLGEVEGSAWKDTMNVMDDLGLLELRDSQVLISPSLKEGLADDAHYVFRAALRAVVFAEENNSDLWDTEDGRWSSTGSREFSRIAAWFLERALLREDALVDRCRRDVAGENKVIENEEQLRVFIRWATALGLAVPLFGNTVPDPSVAVREELAAAFDGADQIPTLTLRDRLTSAIPVLRGGSYATGLDRFLTDQASRPPDEASPGLRTALWRLERAGVLKFRSTSDGDPLVLGAADALNPTHATLTTG